jgi:hypothetical protein
MSEDTKKSGGELSSEDLEQVTGGVVGAINTLLDKTADKIAPIATTQPVSYGWDLKANDKA